MKRREPRAITLAEIEQQFELASYWFDGAWCPAVFAARHGWSIRVLKQEMVTSYSRSVTYDYFEMDLDGTITTVPRGHTKDWKPGRVTDIEAAAARYEAPQADARRIV